MNPSNAKAQAKPPPTPGQIIAQQKADAAKAKAATQQVVPVTPSNTALAVPDNRTAAEKYADDLAPGWLVGRSMKFGKGGPFIWADDDSEVPEDAEFIVIADQSLGGWIRFFPPDANGDRAQPERVMNLIYDKNSRIPEREELSDYDKDSWPTGISGTPEDPWKRQQCLVLQNTTTQELATFSTVSKTGNRAVGDLLKHYNRTLRMGGNDFPVVRLRSSGYQDQRFGWIATPMFVIVGKAPPNSTAKPDTSPAGDMNDALPF